MKSEGSIILTLSNSALYSSGGGPVYTASKHAGVGIMKELAYEVWHLKYESMLLRLQV